MLNAVSIAALDPTPNDKSGGAAVEQEAAERVRDLSYG